MVVWLWRFGCLPAGWLVAGWLVAGWFVLVVLGLGVYLWCSAVWWL